MARADEVDSAGVDLGRVPLGAVFIFPLAGLNAAFDINGAALREVLVTHLGGLSPDDDAVPFGSLLALAALVVPGLAGRQGEVYDGLAVRSRTELRIATEVTDENCFIDTCHGGAPAGRF